VTRYNLDGSLDSTFGVGGEVTTQFGSYSWAFALALQPARHHRDEKIVVAGYAWLSQSPGFRFAVARYDLDGSLDSTIGEGGEVTTQMGSNAAVAALAIQSDGKIVAAGFADRRFALARYLGS
jgi:uncharacterized delta-60 repeat protein